MSRGNVTQGMHLISESKRAWPLFLPRPLRVLALVALLGLSSACASILGIDEPVPLVLTSAGAGGEAGTNPLAAAGDAGQGDGSAGMHPTDAGTGNGGNPSTAGGGDATTGGSLTGGDGGDAG